ncbi:8790_t:CDS:2 [Diversispora eburnea]|uniref:8790_t:CDS:1 n=1 Tax=Diversispora eburnea TaxID=1213867 RepID=A0A9N9C1C6_9GLOM|nr:8790_t:CDS:2 [Diversispora eburnea]
MITKEDIQRQERIGRTRKERQKSEEVKSESESVKQSEQRRYITPGNFYTFKQLLKETTLPEIKGTGRNSLLTSALRIKENLEAERHNIENIPETDNNIERRNRWDYSAKRNGMKQKKEQFRTYYNGLMRKPKNILQQYLCCKCGRMITREELGWDYTENGPRMPKRKR